MARVRIAVAALLMTTLAGPVVAAPAEHEVEFPPGWTLATVDEPIGEGPARVSLEASPSDGSELCTLVDLGPVVAALADIGVTDAETMTRVASDLLGLTGASIRSFGRGYSEPWSASTEGTLDDGSEYVLHSYLGRDAWPGLEDEWVVMLCRSSEPFHQDWRLIGRTFAFTMPAAMRESGGPLVYGGRIEVPTLGLGLEVPEGWAAADLGHPDVSAALETGGGPGRWLALQLEHSIGESMANRAESGERLALWAWSTEDRSGWPEHCELVVREGVEPFSAADLVAAGQRSVDDDPGNLVGESWSLETLPVGEAARYDYRWSETAGGTDFVLSVPPDVQLTLTCQDHALGDEADVSVKRARWSMISQTIESLP